MSTAHGPSWYQTPRKLFLTNLALQNPQDTLWERTQLFPADIFTMMNSLGETWRPTIPLFCSKARFPWYQKPFFPWAVWFITHYKSSVQTRFLFDMCLNKQQYSSRWLHFLFGYISVNRTNVQTSNYKYVNVCSH